MTFFLNKYENGLYVDRLKIRSIHIIDRDDVDNIVCVLNKDDTNSLHERIAKVSGALGEK